MTNCVIYVRISRDREGGGLGVQRQREDCEAKARELGWNVINTYSDNDVSAYSGRVRKGYRALLAALEAGEATGVVIWHADRLHRSMSELEEYIRICEAHGVVTESVKAGHLDLATPSGRMVARQLGAVARYESEHKSERIRRKHLQNAQSGKSNGGGRKFGFAPDGVTVDPVEAAEIVRAGETILAGGSLRGAARDLNERGITTSRGRPWGTSEVRAMLLRPRNAGLVVYQGSVIGNGPWDPIIPERQWRALVATLKDPARRTSPGVQPRWLGSCLYHCVCGGVMVIATIGAPGKVKAPTYRCRDHSGEGDLHSARLASALDEFIGRVVIERLSREDAVDLLGPSDAGVDVVALSAERSTLVNRQDEAAQLFALGRVTGMQLASVTAALSAEISAIDAKLSRAAAVNPLAAIVGTEDVAATWAVLDLDVKRSIIRALMVVTVRPARRGRPPGWRRPEDGQRGTYFDAESIDVRWIDPEAVEPQG